ncbi:MAG: cupin domain-containing protein [Burkholderiales bacterium]
MKATLRTMSAVMAGIAVGTAGSTACAEDGGLHAVRPDEIAWKEVRMSPLLCRAVIHGDQDRPGSFTFRVRAAAGHRLMPHTHPDERVITVLEGTYWSAVGDIWDESRLIAFPRGSFYVVPAGVPHFSGVLDGETVFQESGTGPSRNDMIPQPAGAR